MNPKNFEHLVMDLFLATGMRNCEAMFAMTLSLSPSAIIKKKVPNMDFGMGWRSTKVQTTRSLIVDNNALFL